VAAESGRRYDRADLELAQDLAYRAAIALESAELYRELHVRDRRKDEFLATLSHELRNPLAPIRHAVEILRLAPDHVDTRERTLGLLERQVKHLVRLVDDLLEITRITLGKLELRRERVSLLAVLEAALETSRPQIDAAGQQLTVALPERPVMLFADLTRLGQVFSNSSRTRASIRRQAAASRSRRRRGRMPWSCASPTTASASRRTCFRTSSTCSRRRPRRDPTRRVGSASVSRWCAA
jgi:K+-sensing histidine kinase KdpD